MPHLTLLRNKKYHASRIPPFFPVMFHNPQRQLPAGGIATGQLSRIEKCGESGKAANFPLDRGIISRPQYVEGKAKPTTKYCVRAILGCNKFGQDLEWVFAIFWEIRGHDLGPEALDAAVCGDAGVPSE